jgi:hypothetical protein
VVEVVSTKEEDPDTNACSLTASWRIILTIAVESTETFTLFSTLANVERLARIKYLPGGSAGSW